MNSLQSKSPSYSVSLVMIKKNIFEYSTDKESIQIVHFVSITTGGVLFTVQHRA